MKRREFSKIILAGAAGLGAAGGSTLEAALFKTKLASSNSILVWATDP